MSYPIMYTKLNDSHRPTIVSDATLIGEVFSG